MSLSSVSLDPCHHSRLCERVFQKSSPSRPSSPPPPPPDSCRRLIEIMADSCETKHSFSAVCDIKEGSRSRIFFLSFFPPSYPSLSFYCLGYCERLRELIACGGGDVLITGSLLIAACTRTRTISVQELNGRGLSPARKGHSFISCPHTGSDTAPFFPLPPQHFAVLKITLKCPVLRLTWKKKTLRLLKMCSFVSWCCCIFVRF